MRKYVALLLLNLCINPVFAKNTKCDVSIEWYTFISIPVSPGCKLLMHYNKLTLPFTECYPTSKKQPYHGGIVSWRYKGRTRMHGLPVMLTNVDEPRGDGIDVKVTDPAGVVTIYNNTNSVQKYTCAGI